MCHVLYGSIVWRCIPCVVWSCSLVTCTICHHMILLAPPTQQMMSHWVGSSERPMHIYQITQCNIPHNGNLKYLWGFKQLHQAAPVGTRMLWLYTISPLTVILKHCSTPSCYLLGRLMCCLSVMFNPYPTAFPYGNSMVLHFYQQQESSMTKTVHKVINKGLKTYV